MIPVRQAEDPIPAAGLDLVDLREKPSSGGGYHAACHAAILLFGLRSQKLS